MSDCYIMKEQDNIVEIKYKNKMEMKEQAQTINKL